MAKILVVEDQPVQLDSVRRGLEAEGYDVLSAATGCQCQELSESQQPDAVILDLMLPDSDGLQVLGRLRKRGFLKPVLIVSARDTVDQRIDGLNTGADDYLVKPFVFSELLARVRALLRRTTSAGESTLSFADLHLDLVTRTVTRGGRPIEMPPRQFDLLAYFLRHKNMIVSREMLAKEIWRETTATWTNVIEVQINRLRKSLDAADRNSLIQTIRGEGYLLGDRPL